jgi:putative Mn2+ efflux pump MntP
MARALGERMPSCCMPFVSVLVLSVGLAMDATAVSLTRGAVAERVRCVDALLVALFFGGFQALMPALGFLLGARWGAVFQDWDHWLAFALLGALGVKMLLESRHSSTPNAAPRSDAFGLRVLFVLAVATSIDALAVGFTLPLLGASLIVPVVTIGVVTAALSGLGVLVGGRVGGGFGKRLDAFGGLILIALGTKILVEHLSAA